MNMKKIFKGFFIFLFISILHCYAIVEYFWPMYGFFVYCKTLFIAL